MISEPFANQEYLGKPMRVLLIEDNPPDIEIVQLALQDDPASAWDFRHSQSLEKASAKFIPDLIDVILLDLGLDSSDGIETFKQAFDTFPTTPIIILSAIDSVEIAEQAVELGAQDFLLKDEFNAERLRRCLRYAVKRPPPWQPTKSVGEFVKNTSGGKQREIRLQGEMHEHSPSEFERLVAKFESLVEESLNIRIFSKNHNITSDLDLFGSAIAGVRGSALDLVDIQRIAVKNMAIGKNRRRQLAQAEEGRLLLIGVMARLADHYRNECLKGSANN